MLLVYCEHITPRVTYIFQFMLRTLCGLDYLLTSNENEYCLHHGTTLNYSNKQLRENDITIRPNGFLFLKTLTNCEALIKKENEKIRLLLKAEGADASLFDPFAAAFYLVSRYEEYLNYKPDVHNRFEAAASILFKKELLTRPLVNEWAKELKQTFLDTHTALSFHDKAFNYKITIDVDQAFAFQNRGFIRNTGALVKNLIQAKRSFLKSQWQTFIFNKTDAFNTFDYIHAQLQALGFPTIYFINVGSASKYDKNLPTTNVRFKKLLNRLKRHAEVGLHPSYYSDSKPEKLIAEKKALETAIAQPVTQSRQHYLKLSLPQTYRRLLQAGITEDYTMGYSSHHGFRAGTCTPFYWFDLEQNTATALTVFPITYMEGSLAVDLNLQPEPALEIIKKLTDTVRMYNGTLIPIWHNHTVNDQFFWKGWKKIFQESLHYIIKK